MLVVGQIPSNSLGLMRIFISWQLWTIGILCILAGDVFGGGNWSIWFSALDVAGADNSTLDWIKELSPCSAEDIIGLQCRAKNLSTLETSSVPCNMSEVCADHSQILEIFVACPEVEVRVKCPEDTTETQATTDQPLKVNGGFIAMAAGLSVIVPLICVLIIQLRRSKREERERAAAATAAAAAAAAEAGQAAEDSPPTYEQLFGPSVTPVSGDPLHSRQGSLDILIETDETRRLRASNVQLPNNEVNAQAATGHIGQTAESSGQRPIDGGVINQGYSNSSVSTISGSEVFYYPLSDRFSSQGNSVSSSQFNLQLHQVSSIDSVDSVRNSSDSGTSSTSSEDMSPISSGPSSLSSGESSMTSVQSSSSTSTSSLASTSASSADHRGESSPSQQPPPPPPYTSPATHRNNFVVSTTPGQSSIQQMLRRLPGMHISLQDILVSIGLQQVDNTGLENEVPPPSYEEALKILECAKLSNQNILGKID